MITFNRPKYIWNYILILFGILPQLCFAQKGLDTGAIKRNISKANKLIASKPDSSDILLDDAIRKLKKSGNYHFLLASALMTKGTKELFNSNQKKALIYYQEAHDILVTHIPEDTVNILTLKLNIAVTYYSMDMYHIAYRELVKTVNLLHPDPQKPILDTYIWGYCQTNLSTCLFEIGKVDESIQNSRESIKVLSKKLFNPKVEQIYYLSHIGLGSAYFSNKSYTEAIASYAKGIPYFKKTGLKVELFNVYSNIAHCFINLGQKDSARFYLDLASPLEKELKEPRTKSSYYLVYSKYKEMIRDYTAALGLINKGINIIGNQSMKGVADLYLIKAGILEKLNRLDSSLATYKIYNSTRDSVLKISRQNLIYELEIIHNSGKLRNKLNQELLRRKQIETQIANEKSKRIKFQLLFGIIVLIISAIYIVFRLRINHRKIIQAKKIEIDLLISRIEGQEFERDRISRDLHDSIINDIMRTAYKLNEIPRTIESQNIIDEIASNLRTMKKDIHDFAYDISPFYLLHADFTRLIESITKDLTQPDFLITIHNTWTNAVILSDHLKIELIKLIKEILTNIKVHSNANELDISFYEAHDSYIIEFKDNGKAYNFSSRIIPSLGEFSINKRAQNFNAKVSLTRNANFNHLIIEIPANYPKS